MKDIDNRQFAQYNVIHRKGMLTMAISVRLSPKETELIKKYAELRKVSVSELIRQTIMERIEDEYDLAAYERARWRLISKDLSRILMLKL